MSGTLTNNRSRSTLSDVALRAGVSASTVSLVLAGKAERRRISEDTHQRVHDAARALGYTPSLLHRSMRRGRTSVLSFYNGFRNRDWSDLYMDQLSAAVAHAAGNLGYDVLSHCNYRRDVQETYEFLNGGLSDGLILFGPSADDPLLSLLRTSSLPTVLVGNFGDETTLSTVQDDLPSGMRRIAEEIVRAGHVHIAAVAADIHGQFEPTGRVRRLQQEIAKLGVELPDERIVRWRGSASDIVRDVLALEPRPTAIFVWHDRSAYRIVEACEAAGLRIPQDLSIVGYDGLVWPSTTGQIVASTVVSLKALGHAAVVLLDRLIEGDAGPFSETISVRFDPGTTLGLPAPMP